MAASAIDPTRTPPIAQFAARSRGGGRAADAWWAWGLVAGAVAWGLVNLRALLIPVTYLDDSSLHEQMVRFATAQLRAGHDPLTTWFPYLGEGSPQFLHYQSLPAMIAGAVGLLTGPDVAFRWSLYLLLASWPVSVYLAGRLFGAGRAAASASAAMAPFVWSASGVGYEQHAYIWVGFGVWTQLWAMWTLPLAWGLCWRAIRDGCGYLPAVILTAVTVALHFETGYLALSVLLVWPLVAGRPWLAHCRRAALTLCGSLLAAAWVIVPLLSQREWAAVNEPLRGTPLENGYGAHRVLVWLLSGQILDHGRLPVLTVLAAIGFALAWLSWRKDANGRALLIALAVCLLLSFGRTTFGSLIDVVPGSRDLFFRRFEMGVQLACLLLAGRGAGWVAGHARAALHDRAPRWPTAGTPLLGVIATVVVLIPAWRELDRYDRQDGAAINAQRAADLTEGADLDLLTATVDRLGGGRTYAGMPSNWGQAFTVGDVPVFKYLEARDVDEVGYTLRTASLMTDPEFHFDERDPSDYRLFAIRYLILPVGRQPPVPARLIRQAGPYTLWTIPHDGYTQAGAITGTIAADRGDIGVRSVPVLHSHLAQHDRYLRVAFDHPDPTRGRRSDPARPAAGHVDAAGAELSRGTAAATVTMRRAGVVVLSASFDPGWTATVDGRSRPTEMVAPALVATTVAAGTHRVAFRYRGDDDYPVLFAVGAATLLALLAAGIARRSCGRVARRGG